MSEEAVIMSDNPKARAEMGRLIARAGFTQRELAEAAGVSDRTIYDLTSPPTGREGRTRPSTAWKIARAYAERAGVTDEAAYLALFSE